MLNFCSLYSGSSGNSLFVSSKGTRILVDSGPSCKKICEGLASINSSIEKIDAILITHEHSDHINSLGMVSSKYNIPVYANLETWNAMGKQREKIDESNINLFEVDRDFDIGDLTIHPFSIPHDAANPCGFSIHNGKKKLSIATDLGHMTDDILKELEDSSFVLLESNYDPDILKISRYPMMLKRRIDGPNGHLSNISAGKTVGYLMQKNLNQVMLGHLSKENNFPELAYQTVAEELMKSNADINTIKIDVASRTTPSKIIKV